MIIVEGLDNTGKTTLVEAIKAEYPVLQIYPSIGNKHDVKSIARRAHDESVHPHVSRFTLSDRSRLISEYCYQTVLKIREPAYDMPTWLHMLGNFAQGHHLIIYAQRSMNDIIESFDEKEQLTGVFENLFLISHYYDRTMAMLSHLFDVAGSGSTVVPYEFHVGKGYVMNCVEQYIQEVS